MLGTSTSELYPRTKMIVSCGITSNLTINNIMNGIQYIMVVLAFSTQYGDIIHAL